MIPRRSRFFAVVVLVGQLLLLAARAPDRRGDAATLLAGMALRAMAPVLAAVDGVSDWRRRSGNRGSERRELIDDNRRLKEEVARLRREQLRRAALDDEVAALGRAIDYQRSSGLELRAAEVVYLDRTSWLRAMVVRVGARGARLDQAVVNEDGVIGRVIEVSGPWAKVQLVTDRAAAVGVQLERARRQGIARGSGNGEMVVDYVPRQAEVAIGERVLTAGIDGIYPRALPVGVVVAVEPASEMFHQIRVRPAVELGALTTVYLVEREAPPASLAAGTDAPR